MIQGFGQEITEIPAFGHDITEVRAMGQLVWQKSTSIPDYLCFTALEAGQFTLTIPAAVTPTYLSYIEWSKDGRTWNHTDNTSEAVTIDVQVTQGEKVYWRGSGNTLSTGTLRNSTGNTRFSSTGRFTAKGDLLSMLYGEDFESHTTFTNARYQFCGLFEGCVLLTSVASLVLRPETLTVGCYARLFYGCTSLVDSPVLNATSLQFYVFMYTFYGCSSLVTAFPSISGARGYSQMCNYMYEGCTSLVNAPELPATVMDSQCYERMFANCTSLVNAPILPATQLTNYCYRQMFYGCTNLKYVKCLATDISATNCLNNWLSGVSSTGTFIQAEGVTWPRGASGIPTGWLAYDEGEEIPNDYTPCDYIYNTTSGTGAMSLGFAFGTKNNTLEIKFKQDEISNGMPCGSNSADGRIWLYNYANISTPQFTIYIKPLGTAQIAMNLYSPLDTAIHTVKYVGDDSDQYYYHNGTRVGHGIVTTLSDTCSDNLCIFGRPNNPYKGRIYYLKVWNTATEEVICNLIPCSRNSDGAAGFWDTAQKKFFTSTYWTAHNDNE